ncbi:TonB-dependent hemoglobin/transferrin/lactoferrin family receptor [Rhizobium sp. DKSPLA3]|uniref:TonB-dependent hemoglobin/transferrin/lactoferrin family receptor n=1 Tax=Rhizobium quercicola TaxID=2901226 RepID=A0A9X1NN78_9HYPH|nr:TonB-dependent hemoglobin/transferrin/lactoferrin family receptor [Rhizobium quercicola]MCD7108107.1 TonB-dependent hemoglobin/transferrin/lactoferrin family receptor [Rhizobium quercicola]
MVSRGLRSILLACSSLMVVGAFAPVTLPAFAQETPPAQGTASTQEQTALPTIIVKGNRVRQGAPEDTPLATRTTAEQIAEKDIDDLDDLGDTTEPGVSFVSATKSVNIRGLEADRVLTTIDGIPIPYLSDGVRNSQGGVDTYDFASLGTVDILRGADSSRAGSGALGGAIILRTLEPDDLIADGATVGGVAKLGYDGSDRSLTGAAAIAKRFDNTSVLFQSSYKYGHEDETGGDVGGYGATRTEAEPMDLNRRNILFKVRQSLEGGHTIGLTAEHYGQNTTTDLRATQGLTYQPDDYDRDSDKKRDRVSLDYFFDATSGDSWIDSAFATVYFQRAERIEGTHGTRLTPPRGYYMRSSDNEARSYGASGYANSSFDTGLLHHQVTFGGNIDFTRTSQYQKGDDSCDEFYVPTCANYHNNRSDMPDTDSLMVGLFAENKIGFGNSGVSLTPGLRLDWYRHDPQETSTYTSIGNSPDLPEGQSDVRLSPKLRAAWQIHSDVELFAQVTTGFKAPNVTQLYTNYDNAPLYRSIGNPDLDPETSYGFEAGANFGDEDFGGRIAAYTTRYKNFIDSETTPEAGYRLGTIEYFNRDRVRISGIEARAQKTFSSGIDLHGSLAYARGTDLDTDELLASVAPLKAIVGVGYNTEVWGTDLSLVTAAAVDDDSIAGTKPGGYGIVNLTGWWEPEQAKGLRIQGGVYNLFDKTYFDALEVKDIANASELYSEAGRTFKISLTQKF